MLYDKYEGKSPCDTSGAPDPRTCSGGFCWTATDAEGVAHTWCFTSATPNLMAKRRAYILKVADFGCAKSTTAFWDSAARKADAVYNVGMSDLASGKSDEGSLALACTVMKISDDACVAKDKTVTMDTAIFSALFDAFKVKAVPDAACVFGK
jgi:hypothetical protein